MPKSFYLPLIKLR